MMIKDLIKELQKLDSNLEVYSYNYDGSIDRVNAVHLGNVAIGANADNTLYGMHEEVSNDFDKGEYPESKFKIEEGAILS